MEPTIKRIIGKGTSCEDAKGEYCYCQCMGVFHGINHQPIKDRQLKLKAENLPLDICNCENSDPQDRVWLHQKTNRFFRVCKVCGGRLFVQDVEGIVSFITSKGIRI